MDKVGITLKDFFSYRENAVPEKKLSEAESGKGMSSVKQEITKGAKETKWPVARDEIIKKVGDLLNVGIPEIMVGAWNKYREILKYADREKYDPEETILVPLVEHTIKSEHHPYLEVLINDKPVGKIRCDILISLTVKGITLKIQDAKIKEILTGTCKGKGTLKLENCVILEEDTESLPLPGSISLGEGVPIVP